MSKALQRQINAEKRRRWIVKERSEEGRKEAADRTRGDHTPRIRRGEADKRGRARGKGGLRRGPRLLLQPVAVTVVVVFVKTNKGGGGESQERGGRK